MRENAVLLAVAEAAADPRRGTPAGNSEFTQEQYDALRQMGLKRGDYRVRDILVPSRPPCPGDIPAEHQAQSEMMIMPCPVLGEKMIAVDVMAPILLLPSGLYGVPRE
jgi:hypothetical protein